MSAPTFRIGDRISFTSWGVTFTGTVIANPQGNVVLMQRDDTGRTAWKHFDSVQHITPTSED